MLHEPTVLALFLSRALMAPLATVAVLFAASLSSAPLHAAQPAVGFGFARINEVIAGTAGDETVVFVGEPLNGMVVALSRLTGTHIGQLPTPPGGFVLPFIMHTIGAGRLAVLDAGGLPQPGTGFASPTIYEHAYHFVEGLGFSASLVRTVSFAAATIGFSEDFVRLDDGRYLLSDAVLGSIWIAEQDGTIVPGIVANSVLAHNPNPADLIPDLAFCGPMPTVTVNGFPFLFTASTLPGVSPLAVRDGTVYFFSPCARGIYSFPLAALSDSRMPFQRAANIRLVAPTPANIQVEELLDFTFNPFNAADKYLYAADPLQLQVIRIDLKTGARQVLASGPVLFDFPSSLGFLPTIGPVSELVVVSNQQERSPLTNDAVTQTSFNLPFVVAKILVLP